MPQEAPDQDAHSVPPLEHRAFFDVDTNEGYVHIEQSRGEQTLYTPEEATDVAEAILDAARKAEQMSGNEEG